MQACLTLGTYGTPVISAAGLLFCPLQLNAKGFLSFLFNPCGAFRPVRFVIIYQNERPTGADRGHPGASASCEKIHHQPAGICVCPDDPLCNVYRLLTRVVLLTGLCLLTDPYVAVVRIQIVDEPGGIGFLNLIGIAGHCVIPFCFQTFKSSVPFPTVTMERRHNFEICFAGRQKPLRTTKTDALGGGLAFGFNYLTLGDICVFQQAAEVITK